MIVAVSSIDSPRAAHPLRPEQASTHRGSARRSRRSPRPGRLTRAARGDEGSHFSKGDVRILFLTCHLPYPPISGGRLREYELLRRIALRADVFVCAVSNTYA